MTEFTITPDHLRLLKRLHFRFDGSIEFGAPAVDPKRPYGNSDVYADMASILGIDRELEMPEEARNVLYRLHEEMTTVLQIGCKLGRFEAGAYTRPDRYGDEWEPKR